MVSVIVPVFNAEKTIERCLKSLINQTLTELEIIVVNDGSTDNTVNVINSLKSDKIKLVNQENRGQGIARNNGIKLAKGDYIGFADADDSVDLNMYKSMYAAAVKYDAELVQCGIIDIRGNQSQARAADVEGLVTINDREEYAVNYFMALKHTNEVCNKLIKKTFLLDNNLQFDDTRLVFSEDLLLNIKMLSHLNRVYYINKPFYFYNISNDGHCLKGGRERLEKICTLFKAGAEYSADNIKPSVRCVACSVIWEYCAKAGNDDVCMRVLKYDFVKACMRTSMKYKATLHHRAVMGIVCVLPVKMKLKVIKYIVNNKW
ncbi:MAG: glycosyltransferase family 2 protein [Clostridiales bacterium]|nr:glycosyltransferase family 2 protein [Clostridiales bacterium]